MRPAYMTWGIDKQQRILPVLSGLKPTVVSALALMEWSPDDLPDGTLPGVLALSVIVGALAFSVLNRKASRRPPSDMRKKIPSLSAVMVDSGSRPAAGDEAKPSLTRHKSGSEKRRHVRRNGGNPIAVRIAESRNAGGDAQDGVVQNRSKGGLLLAARKSATVGSLFWVRAVDAPDDVEWVSIQIRHCQQLGDRWLWGCKFMQELPWSLLLHFG